LVFEAETIMARLFSQALGNAAAMYVTLPDVIPGQDEHVLGHPLLLARHPARDPQRKHFFPSRACAVARSDAPDQFFFGKCTT